MGLIDFVIAIPDIGEFFFSNPFSGISNSDGDKSFLHSLPNDDTLICPSIVDSIIDEVINNLGHLHLVRLYKHIVFVVKVNVVSVVFN